MSDAAITTKHRRPRFRRVEDSTSFQLTDRDVKIISQVARHGFLRSTHISCLLAAPHKKICERLTSLYHAGFLDRPRSQLEYYVYGGGSASFVYALDNKGAHLLRTRGRSDKAKWIRTSRDNTRQFLLHTLSVADFRVALAVACRARPDVSLIEPEELLRSAPEPTQLSSNPWSWRVHVQFKGFAREIGVVPDYVFALTLPDGRRRPFVVECDRGTMPIERHSLSQTSILRKFLAYEASYKKALHMNHFGWKNFRVLIIAENQNRIESMQALVDHHAQITGSPLFLFADRTLMQGDIFSHRWASTRAAKHTLL